jgi:hypothetical protein
MGATEWLKLILLGGSVGAMGQMARAIVGMKKLNDQATLENKTFQDIFELTSLVVSIMIGFTAGVFAAVLMQGQDPTPIKLAGANILALAGAGYSGADFIEGIINRVTSAAPPKNGAPTGGESKNQEAPSGAAGQHSNDAPSSTANQKDHSVG